MNLSEYKPEIVSLIQLAYNEDVRTGDVTCIGTIPEDLIGSAKLLLKDDGVIAGLSIIPWIFEVFGISINYFLKASDGKYYTKGTALGLFTGSVRSLLMVERTLLNFLQRMSGVATTTYEYSKVLENTQTKLLDTRKTIPGFRVLDKYAVHCGGAMNHRFGLWDMILIKDNHIDANGSIEVAIEKAYANSNGRFKIEVETRTIDDVHRAIATGKVDRIMLDNFTIEQMHEAVSFIPKHIETEVSGGVTIETLSQIASTNVNYISVGAITHSVKALDISFKIVH
jgi:nicotinate-nucleotide pyrophosphorylase (carboxylating)